MKPINSSEVILPLLIATSRNILSDGAKRHWSATKGKFYKELVNKISEIPKLQDLGNEPCLLNAFSIFLLGANHVKIQGLDTQNNKLDPSLRRSLSPDLSNSKIDKLWHDMMLGGVVDYLFENL